MKKFMKKLIRKLMSLLVPLLFVGMVYGQAADPHSPDVGINWTSIIVIAIGVIEVVARAIPNRKITGIFGLVINVLKDLSDWLNRGDD